MTLQIMLIRGDIHIMCFWKLFLGINALLLVLHFLALQLMLSTSKKMFTIFG
jgi:hypothetical protein